MAEMFETVEDVQPKVRHKGGIKAFTFTPSGTNGTSHRQNAARKKKNYLNNRKIRGELYSQLRGERANAGHGREWHARLDALSKGVTNE